MRRASLRPPTGSAFSEPPRDKWTRAVPVLAAAHAALYGTLQARPGMIGIILWYVGPLLIALVAVIALLVAFVSSVRRRHVWSPTRLAGYLGLVAAVAVVPLYRTYPSSHDSRPSGVKFRVPLAGPVTVAWGGATSDMNYHVILPDQRWAYDLLVTRIGRSFRGTGAIVSDYYAYDLPVVAPASGVVRIVHDGEPDTGVGRRRIMRALGNHIVIEVAPEEFLFLVHLRPRSITVAAGDHVASGQTVGRVGNSGNSSEPHLHLHLQDTSTPYFGEGIPFEFSDYRINSAYVAQGIPTGGLADRRYVGQVIRSVGETLQP